MIEKEAEPFGLFGQAFTTIISVNKGVASSRINVVISIQANNEEVMVR